MQKVGIPMNNRKNDSDNVENDGIVFEIINDDDNSTDYDALDGCDDDRFVQRNFDK